MPEFVREERGQTIHTSVMQKMPSVHLKSVSMGSKFLAVLLPQTMSPSLATMYSLFYIHSHTWGYWTGASQGSLRMDLSVLLAARSLQENWRYQENISSKIGTIKDTNGMDLTEAEDINKRW